MIELLFCLHLQTLSCRWITGSSHNSPGHSQSSSPVHTPNPHGQRYNALCSTVTSSHAGVCCVLTFKTEVLTAKKCPIYLFIFSSIDPDVGGGGELELHWNTSGRRHLLHVSQHAKGWIQTFFFFLPPTETRPSSALRPTLLHKCRGLSHLLKICRKVPW